MRRIDSSSITPFNQIEGEDRDETEELQDMTIRAADFLEGFDWCSNVIESYLGIAVGGIVVVCLFKIRPAKPDIDEWLWVVYGDLPSSYLVTDDAPNPACALMAYIDEMRRWINAVKKGESLKGVIPVNAPPTVENAEALEERLETLWRDFLEPNYAEDLMKRYEEE